MIFVIRNNIVHADRIFSFVIQLSVNKFICT
eukprot:UN05531